MLLILALVLVWLSISNEVPQDYEDAVSKLPVDYSTGETIDNKFVFNNSCYFSKENAERFIVENPQGLSFFTELISENLSVDSYRFRYFNFKCWDRISHSIFFEESSTLLIQYQPIPKKGILYLLVGIFLIYIRINRKYKDYSRELDQSYLKKSFKVFSFIFLLSSIVMFFYAKVPQFESNIGILSSRFLTFSEPNENNSGDGIVPRFDQNCLYSQETALEALEKNNIKMSSVEIVPYRDNTFLAPSSNYLYNFKCWDRIVSSNVFSGKTLESGEKLRLTYVAYPKWNVLFLSFLFFLFSFRRQDSIKTNKEELLHASFLPNWSIRYLHIIVLFSSAYLFIEYSTYVEAFSLYINWSYFASLLIFFAALIFFIKKDVFNNKLVQYFSIASMSSFALYSITFFLDHSISEIMSDIDVFQSQLPISVYQFNQVKDYGDLFIWNNNIGAGFRMEGQYGVRYIMRDLIYTFSPTFVAASNIYFFFHLILGQFFMILLLDEIGFNKKVAVLGSAMWFGSNQFMTWIPFLHYPAFIMSFPMIIYAVVISKKKALVSFSLFNLGVYILASGSHLQNLFLVYLFTALFLLVIYFNRNDSTLYEKLDYKIISVSAFASVILSSIHILPFIEVLNNVGDRAPNIADYLLPGDLFNFFSNHILQASKDMKWKYNINIQLFSSTLFLFWFCLFRTKKQNLEKIAIITLLSLFTLSTNNPLQNILQDNIPGLSYISNWQRIAPFLIFVVMIYTMSKVEAFLHVENSNFAFIIILFSLILSTHTRANVLWNNNVPNRYSYQINNIYEGNISNLKTLLAGIDTENSRIISTCNDTLALPLAADAGLTVNPNIKWAGIYESFPNKFYTDKFKYISGTYSGNLGGRYYTHKIEDPLFIENIDLLSIRYILENKNGCNLALGSSFTKVGENAEFNLYEHKDFTPIIFITDKDGNITLPDSINRINPEKIIINHSKNGGEIYLNINEIYDDGWKANLNNSAIDVLNHEGYMRIKLDDNVNDIELYFERVELSRYIDALVIFLRNM